MMREIVVDAESHSSKRKRKQRKEKEENWVGGRKEHNEGGQWTLFIFLFSYFFFPLSFLKHMDHDRAHPI